MLSLLVSKIDDIQIVQVGESKISIRHKKCTSKKPAKKSGFMDRLEKMQREQQKNVQKRK